MAQAIVHHPHSQSTALAGSALDLLLLEFGVSAMAAGICELGNLGRATVFAAVARAGGPFGSEPSRHERWISVNALAASLRRPFETTRRTANALIDAGLLARSPAGLRLANAAQADPRTLRFGHACHDLLVRLIDDLRACNVQLPAGRADVHYDPQVGIGVAFDLFLAAFECQEGDDRRLMRIALLSAVEWANKRDHGTGGTREMPRPVKPSAIARLLGLPYATAARNLDQMARCGALTRRAGGLILEGAGGSTSANAELVNRARQLIGRLAQSGFPMHMPSAAYVQSRPRLTLG
jgi:hypothetical protein